MCGILGIYGKIASEINIKEFKNALRLIDHRGPDAEGVYIGDNIILGHKRLSIIDLDERSNQPMEDDNGIIIFAGEIYNYKDVKTNISDKKFRTEGDTEVLMIVLNLMEKNNDTLFNTLNGMWSFAYFSKKTHKLYLSVDRLGKKPLYYYQDNSSIIFSSEILPILYFSKINKINIDIEEKKIREILIYDMTLDITTPFTKIYKVAPSTLLTFSYSKNKIEHKEKRYFNAQPTQYNLLDLLKDAVMKRYVSDAKVALSLSGGIDSSTILLLSKMIYKKEFPYNIFSVKYENVNFDESKIIEKTIKDLGLENNHHFINISVEDTYKIIENEFNNFLYIYNDLTFKIAGINRYLFFKEVRNQDPYLKVMLFGDGGDEMFYGYLWYRRLKRLDFFKQYQLLGKIHSLINKRVKEYLQTVKYGNTCDFIEFSEIARFREYNFCQRIINNAIVRHHINNIKEYISTKNEIIRVLRLINIWDMFVKYPWHVVPDTERGSFFNSIEPRSPLSDYRLILYNFSTPHYKNIDIYTGKKELIQLRNKLYKKLARRSPPKYRKRGWGLVPVTEEVLKYLEEKFREDITNYFTFENLGVKIESKTKYDKFWFLSKIYFYNKWMEEFGEWLSNKR